MIQDYAELVTEVAERTGIPIASRAAQYVGMAERYLNQQLRVGDMEATASVTTDSSGEVALPTDYLSMRQVRVSDYQLRQASLAGILNGSKNGYAVRGTTFVSSEKGTAHTLYYYQELPGLAENSTNWLLSQDPEIYVDAVSAQAYKAKFDAEKYQALMAVLFRSIRRINRQDASARHGRMRMSAGGYRP